VRVSALSNEELFRVRGAPAEMGISMTKSELIATIGTSRAPVAGQERQEG
jgi:hypothetical protein